ncbi:MAG: hypothetical protein QXV28_07630 [Ignisphaera sp.]
MWKTVVALTLIGIALIILSLTHTTDVENAVAEYCRSSEALKRFTPLVVGRETRIIFRFDGKELTANISGIHIEVVAVTTLDKIYIKNTDLWNLFEWFCVQQYRSEYISKISMYTSITLTCSILLAFIGAWFLVNQIRTRKPR